MPTGGRRRWPASGFRDESRPAPQGGDRRCRPGRPRSGDRLRAARVFRLWSSTTMMSVEQGSRAICWSKRTLEIFDRLGVGARMVDKGVTWKVGRSFRGDESYGASTCCPSPAIKMPAFINLQQYYVEQYLVERAAEFPGLIDLRWRQPRRRRRGGRAKAPRLTIETPDGPYRLDAEWLVACDGARSTLRRLLGLDFAGQRLRGALPDRRCRARRRLSLRTPVLVRAALPCRPVGAAAQAARQHLPHRPPARPGRRPRRGAAARERASRASERMLGHRRFRLDWVSVYAFQCRRLERFVHGRVIFAGDAAHVVSPFGARGGNGGIQDVDNLAWKLAVVLAARRRRAPARQLRRRAHRRRPTRTSPIRPAPPISSRRRRRRSAIFRDAVLELAARRTTSRAGWSIRAGLSRPC